MPATLAACCGCQEIMSRVLRRMTGATCAGTSTMSLAAVAPVVAAGNVVLLDCQGEWKCTMASHG